MHVFRTHGLGLSVSDSWSFYACFSSRQASRARHLSLNGSQIDPLPCHCTQEDKGRAGTDQHTVMCSSDSRSRTLGLGLVVFLCMFFGITVSDSRSRTRGLFMHVFLRARHLVPGIFHLTDHRSTPFPATCKQDDRGRTGTDQHTVMCSSPRSTREGTPTRTPGTSFK